MAVTVPSVSSASGTLSAIGIGSGLDIQGMITGLMAVEQQPITLLDKQEASFQAKLTSLGTVKGAMSSLQSAAQALAAAGAASYSASVSDTSVLTAVTTSIAAAGNYSITVDGSTLAQAHKLVASQTYGQGQPSLSAAIGTGTATTLTIQQGSYSSGTFTQNPAKSAVTLTIDSSNNTLAGIRDAINAAKAGVHASIVSDGSSSPYHLTITSDDTGAANRMKLSVGSGDATIASLLAYDPAASGSSQFTQVQAAQDASFTIDGMTVTSATNSVTGAIPGVTLNLGSKTGTNTITVAIQPASNQVSSALSALVKAYNDANTTIATATAKGAVMQGDWGVLSLQNQVRSILGSMQSTGGSYTNLSQLGLSFAKDGSLTLDSSALGTALSANLVDASSLAKAIGNALNTAATNMLGTTGSISNETAGLNRTITDIGNRRTALQARLVAIQAQYRAQFSALDAVISSMNATSSFLTQQLANLPSLTNNNKG